MNLALCFRLGSPVQCVGLHLGIAQRVVRPLVRDAGLPVVVNEDGGEERLVAQTTVRVIAPPVDVRRVCEQPNRIFQVRASLGVLVVVGDDPVVDRLQLGTDPGLLLLEQVQRHGVGVVRLQQLDPLVVETVTVSGEPSQLLDIGSHQPVERGVEHPGDVLPGLSVDLDGLVVALD
ncbi:hypothetical protein [Propionimicrobium sp. PCR01-08-3]|uniref:hypothetical protein n=1 Tax=Propionimicrobium sp. PCR01-08-3 TaxID=3052086 RepID=UPI00255C51F6|nr:hypothetical protein [Propionimicrobium sp. PCR01-08-3]WIY83442.1 hypothetical protein QQ658_03535 [Propionimicrobium sp. PCR01-08-3]